MHWLQQQSVLNVLTCLLLVVILAFHFRASSKKPYRREFNRFAITWLGTICVGAAFVRIVLQERVELIDVLVGVFAFGVALYVAICDVLLSGLAAYLTKRRGDKWTKELDYIY